VVDVDVDDAAVVVRALMIALDREGRTVDLTGAAAAALAELLLAALRPEAANRAWTKLPTDVAISGVK